MLMLVAGNMEDGHWDLHHSCGFPADFGYFRVRVGGHRRRYVHDCDSRCANLTLASLAGWYEWYPDYAYSFSGIGFSAGDSVTLNVTATSKTAGVAGITNASKGVSVSKKITSTAALCEQDAEWQVEVFSSGVVPSPPVVFTKEEAITNNGTIVIPSGSA